MKYVLSRFNMDDAKLMSTPLASFFKLSKEKWLMKKWPRHFAAAIESLMYVMVCTRPNITHAVGVLMSRFKSNLSKQHREAMRWFSDI